jgi:hypothetical protein
MPRAVVRSTMTRVTSAPVSTRRFLRVIAGRRKAVAAEARRPLRMVYWLRPNPSWQAAL